ncbi:MAG: hypothetical protein CL489_02920 [Acidobacteria bacterium]|nr:hypothetical protein [Acidobacteriota bacterium]
MTEPWHGTQWWRNLDKDTRTASAWIPYPLANARMSNYDLDVGDDFAHGVVTKWLHDYQEHRATGTGLMLVGSHGVGKSHLAVSALRAAIRTYKQCGRYITANGYIRALDDARHNDGILPDSYPLGNLLSYLREVYDVVVIEDVDSVRDTPYAHRELADLLEGRLHNNLVTILTAVHKEALADTVNPKFQSVARGASIVVNVKAADYRETHRGT